MFSVLTDEHCVALLHSYLHLFRVSTQRYNDMLFQKDNALYRWAQVTQSLFEVYLGDFRWIRGSIHSPDRSPIKNLRDVVERFICRHDPVVVDSYLDGMAQHLSLDIERFFFELDIHISGAACWAMNHFINPPSLDRLSTKAGECSSSTLA